MPPARSFKLPLVAQRRSARRIIEEHLTIEYQRFHDVVQAIERRTVQSIVANTSLHRVRQFDEEKQCLVGGTEVEVACRSREQGEYLGGGEAWLAEHAGDLLSRCIRCLRRMLTKFRASKDRVSSLLNASSGLLPWPLLDTRNIPKKRQQTQ